MWSYVRYRSCSKCKWRKGRSAFRRASRQSCTEINGLYDVRSFNDGDVKTLAEKRLTHLGMNPKRRCSLPTVGTYAVIYLFGLQGKNMICFRDWTCGIGYTVYSHSYIGLSSNHFLKWACATSWKEPSIIVSQSWDFNGFFEFLALADPSEF